VPTAAGPPAPLGTSPLWCGTPDMVSLVPRLTARFVHPEVWLPPSVVSYEVLKQYGGGKSNYRTF